MLRIFPEELCCSSSYVQKLLYIIKRENAFQSFLVSSHANFFKEKRSFICLFCYVNENYVQRYFSNVITLSNDFSSSPQEIYSWNPRLDLSLIKKFPNNVECFMTLLQLHWNPSIVEYLSLIDKLCLTKGFFTK